MFIDLIRNRRSIRKFTNEEIGADKVELLKEAALRPPSSMGHNPWEYIFVTDGQLLSKLSKAKPHGSSFLADARLGIVVCADPEKSAVWIEDASIATIFIQLAAESLGLGNCWVQIRARMHDDTQSAETYIAGLLNIPSNLKVESVVGIGYPAEEKAPHTREELQDEKVFLNTYGSPFT
ncbi:Nitroreductase family protein [Olavius sp. associated proteobacterium Delta 1]|nr:Nitroreductase family protein [Olavius sp. associated proteobacterium Delta 1]